MNELWGSLSRTSKVIGGALAPQLSELLGSLSRTVLEVAAWVKENQQLVVTTAKWAAALIGIGGTLTAVGFAVNQVAGAMGALRVAMTAVATHPVGAALVGVTAIVTGLGLAINRATSELDRLSQAQQKQLDQTDRQRAADRRRLRQLQRLNEQQQLSESQMNEAARLIQKLEGRYGDLGLRVNETTGEIEGMAKAQERLNQAQRKGALADVNAAITEQKNNVEALEDQFDKTFDTSSIQSSIAGLQQLLGMDPSDDLKRRIQSAKAELEALQKRRDALKSGGDGDALTGDAGAPGTGGAGSSADAAAKAAAEQSRQRALSKRRDLEQRILEMRIKKNKQGVERELALIDMRYDRERERIEQMEDLEDDKKQVLLEQVGIARDLAKERARSRQEQQREREQQRQQQEIERANEQRRKQVRRLEIKANNEGIEEQRKLLEMREKQAIKEAKRNDENVKLVKREFELRRQLLNQQEQQREAGGPGGGVVGTFSTRALGRRFGFGGGSPQERTADATEKTAKEMQRLRDGLEDGEFAGARFT